MKTTSCTRKMKPNPDYEPCTVREGEELFPNGIFVFNISRIIDDILNKQLVVEEDDINVEDWLGKHCSGPVNEIHMPAVDTSIPIIVAEIRPGMFNVIDGHHRMEKAHREKKLSIHTYKLRGEQLLPYFTEKKSYLCFINYWNEKLKMYGPDGYL